MPSVWKWLIPAAMTLLVGCTLTIEPVGFGSGTVAVSGGNPTCTVTSGVADANCTQEIDDGEVVTLTAAAGGTSNFGGWNGDCDSIVGNVCTVTVDRVKLVFPLFGRVTTSDKGSVPCDDGPSSTALSGEIEAPGDVVVFEFHLDGGVLCVNDFASSSVSLAAGLKYEVITDLSDIPNLTGDTSQSSHFYSDDTTGKVRIYGTAEATGAFSMTVHW